MADAYGLDGDGRAELLMAMEDAIDRIECAAWRIVEEGGSRAFRMVEQTGGIEKYERRRRWRTQHREEFADALR